MGRHCAVVLGAVTFVLALAGCGAADLSEEIPEDAAREAQDAVVEKVLPLPYTKSSDKFGSVQEFGPFDLKQGASLTVVIEASWDRPSTCTKKPYFLTPNKKGWFGYTNGLDPRPVPTDGKSHRETWTNTDAGLYKIELDPRNTNPDCKLVFKVTVSSP
jgi:hypothetical protein